MCHYDTLTSCKKIIEKHNEKLLRSKTRQTNRLQDKRGWLQLTPSSILGVQKALDQASQFQSSIWIILVKAYNNNLHFVNHYISSEIFFSLFRIEASLPVGMIFRGEGNSKSKGIYRILSTFWWASIWVWCQKLNVLISENATGEFNPIHIILSTLKWSIIKKHH